MVRFRWWILAVASLFLGVVFYCGIMLVFITWPYLAQYDGDSPDLVYGWHLSAPIVLAVVQAVLTVVLVGLVSWICGWYGKSLSRVNVALVAVVAAVPSTTLLFLAFLSDSQPFPPFVALGVAFVGSSLVGILWRSE